MKKFLYILIFLASLKTVYVAQTQNKFNLTYEQLSNLKNDTNKVNNIALFIRNDYHADLKIIIQQANVGLELARKLNYIKGTCNLYNRLGDAYWYHSDFKNAQIYYFKAYKIIDSLGDKKGMAESLYNIGWILAIQQKNTSAVKYLYESLSIYKTLNDTISLMSLNLALANYYASQYEIKQQQHLIDSSFYYLNKGLTIASYFNSKKYFSSFTSNIANTYLLSKDYNKAIHYAEISNKMNEEMLDTSRMIETSLIMGKANLMLTNYNKAKQFFLFIIPLANKLEMKNHSSDAYLGLAKCLYVEKKYQLAYDYYFKHDSLQTIIDKDTYSTNLQNSQNELQLEKSEASIGELKQKNEIQELKNTKNKFFIFSLIVVAIIVIGLAIFLQKQNRQKVSVNLKLQEQNHIIAEKKNELEKSIQYAKGIQQAVLPNLEDLTQEFNHSFVYFKPKDVVSGDFYWFKKVEDDFFCVVVDCTGHGVPGALMSIVGFEKIVQAVFNQKLTKTGEILSYLNKEIKHLLKQHSDNTKQRDGMDLAFLKFNTLHNTVEYSGANRPLYLVRGEELVEYKPTKCAIAGFTPDEQVFSTTYIQLQKDDSLYLFSDGYADQFGGDEDKKFMTKNFKQLLLFISSKPAFEQLKIIDETFINWKKDVEQVDDVLVLGIKI